MSLDYLGGPAVSQSILKEGGRQESRVREVDVMTESEARVMWGQETRMQAGSRSWKGQGNGFSPRRNTALPTP